MMAQRTWVALALACSLLSCAGGNALRDGKASETSGERSASDATSGDWSAGDAAAGDASRPDAGPPAKPFGASTSSCSATPYPNETSNAYPTSFQQAVADDWVYIAWVWRLSPDAATNHSVSAMKSKDLKTWYNLCGDPVSLPITPQSPTVIDPVPVNTGLLNSRLALSFDSSKRAVVTYHKNVSKQLADGSTKLTTQVFNARWEGSAIQIYQLTSWNSLDDFGGGGSLPARDTSVSFSGLLLAPSGIVAQRVVRSKSDDAACKSVDVGAGCTAFPASGTWQVQDSAYGLALRSPLVAVSSSALASSDPYENPQTSALTAGPVENVRLSAQGTQWQVQTKMSREELRWTMLRSDFDGDGSNNRGLFDRYNSRFYLDVGAADKEFQFGSRAGLLWPLTGDWNSDGTVTIGIHDLKASRTCLKNTLAGGDADRTLSGPLSSVSGVLDSPLVWHPVSPAARYAIRWESLPANRDAAYTCEGIALTSTSGGCLDGALMSSKLYLFEYDAATGTWKKSLIDRAWGGATVGFDFLTFKNVQLVLYYGQDRYAKIAQRVRSKSGTWSAWAFSTVGTQFAGWDSHNYLTMFVDANHNVHVAGNMHASSLVYFRSSGFFGAADPLTYTKMSMTGQNEAQVTYPVFLRGPRGELVFSYRSGSSGDGDTYLNRYDERAGSWTPLHGTTSAPVSLFRGR